MSKKGTLIAAMAAGFLTAGIPLASQAADGASQTLSAEKAGCKGKGGCKGKDGCKAKDGEKKDGEKKDEAPKKS